MSFLPVPLDVAVLDGFAVLAGVVIETSDCELVRSGFPTQPANMWSSLAYCVAGLWVIVAARRAGPDRATAQGAGGLIALVGVGSLAYHGFGGELSRWLHDVSFLWALGFMAACEGLARPSARFREAVVFGATVIGAATVFPVLTSVVLVVLAGLVTWAESTRWAARPRHERRDLVVVAAVMVAAGAVYLLGRTGSPYCDEQSVSQLHGLWHALTALAFALWARVAFAIRPAVRRAAQ